MFREVFCVFMFVCGFVCIAVVSKAAWVCLVCVEVNSKVLGVLCICVSACVSVAYPSSRGVIMSALCCVYGCFYIPLC